MRLALLVLAVSVGACSQDTFPPEGAVRLVSGAEVTVPPYMKECDVDAACTLVGTGCDQCCQGQAINAAFLDRYEAEFDEACVGYSGGVCDCVAPPATARCVERRCEMVEAAPDSVL